MKANHTTIIRYKKSTNRSLNLPIPRHRNKTTFSSSSKMHSGWRCMDLRGGGGSHCWGQVLLYIRHTSQKMTLFNWEEWDVPILPDHTSQAASVENRQALKYQAESQMWPYRSQLGFWHTSNQGSLQSKSETWTCEVGLFWLVFKGSSK